MFRVIDDKIGYPALPRNCQALSTDKPFPTTLNGVTFLDGSKLVEVDTNVKYVMHDGVWRVDEVNTPVLLTDTTITLTGPFTAMRIKTDGTAFTTFTSNIKKNNNVALVAADLTNMEKGEEVYGIITAVKISSGAVWLYP